MRRIIIYFMFYLLGCSFSVAQGFCKEAVRRAYEKVYKSKDDRVEVNLGTYRRKSLCLGKTKGEIYSAIRNGSVFYYGGVLDSVVSIKIDSQALYFRVSIEDPTSFTILDIYDSNGMNLSCDCDSDYLLMPCVPKSKDGYVYVRKEKSATSKPVAKILKNQIFFFTPCQDSDWYRVSLTSDPTKFVGYVHKSTILPYEKCTGPIRKKMEHLFFCQVPPFHRCTILYSKLWA